MTLEQFRALTRDLPGHLSVEIVVNDTYGGEHAIRTVTRCYDGLLLCSDNQDVGKTETVLFDETPEPRMD